MPESKEMARSGRELLNGAKMLELNKISPDRVASGFWMTAVVI